MTKSASVRQLALWDERQSSPSRKRPTPGAVAQTSPDDKRRQNGDKGNGDKETATKDTHESEFSDTT